ncbi:hypothetical protein HAX54_020266 [Datura stramonium]|uniref:Uncharacterized protein n=1 Tax=Datura stramonium TaxID=4076 RepID=A0ABS8UT03_DATST|nr:hypothetical protein [Datura stramonium]
MESKTGVKFAQIIAFLLLVTSFEALMAQQERAQVSDGLEVIQLPKELKSVDESNLVCQGKLRWPELIGVPAKFAKQIILKENSSVHKVEIIVANSLVYPDFSCNRVRLIINVLNVVIRIPMVS